MVVRTYPRFIGKGCIQWRVGQMIDVIAQGLHGNTQYNFQYLLLRVASRKEIFEFMAVSYSATLAHYGASEGGQGVKLAIQQCAAAT